MRKIQMRQKLFIIHLHGVFQGESISRYQLETLWLFCVMVLISMTVIQKQNHPLIRHVFHVLPSHSYQYFKVIFLNHNQKIILSCTFYKWMILLDALKMKTKNIANHNCLFLCWIELFWYSFLLELQGRINQSQSNNCHVSFWMHLSSLCKMFKKIMFGHIIRFSCGASSSQMNLFLKVWNFRLLCFLISLPWDNKIGWGHNLRL